MSIIKHRQPRDPKTVAVHVESTPTPQSGYQGLFARSELAWWGHIRLAAPLLSSVLATVATAAAFAGAPTAAAAPSNTGSAQDTVNRLQALGYNVALNGSTTAALSECVVTGVHPGDPGSVAAPQFTTVWVDISCPPTNN
jgi:hypothetical protein